jgi:hypothetical protein
MQKYNLGDYITGIYSEHQSDAYYNNLSAKDRKGKIVAIIRDYNDIWYGVISDEVKSPYSKDHWELVDCDETCAAEMTNVSWLQQEAIEVEKDPFLLAQIKIRKEIGI